MPTFFTHCLATPGDFTPGYCHSFFNDCVMEECGVPPPSPGSKGLPSNQYVCKDDDPSCDFGPPGDHACTFHFSLCFNVSLERRFPCKLTGSIGYVHLNKPNEDRPNSSTDIATVAEFERVLVGLGGTVQSAPNGHRSVVFNPPLTQPNECTELASIRVPLINSRGNFRQGKLKVRVRAVQTSGPYDGDDMRFLCLP